MSDPETTDYPKPDNGNTGKILIFPGIDGFSPSMKLVLNILENHGPLTQKEIAKETHLPSRTVRYALNRLKDEAVLEEREYFHDARQCLYQIKC
ncbi:MAG: helix-turn-helix domain-containing protein [Candidatus Methanoperedens sp.]